MLLRSDLKFSVLPTPVGTESVWCKLYLHKQSFVIGVFYRPPGSSVDIIHSLSQFIHEHNFSVAHLVCMGDFNAPGVNWSSMTCTGRDSIINKALLNFSLSAGLAQIVTGNTRFNALLDLVFLSASIAQNGFTQEIIDGISDHKAVLFHLPCSLPKPVSVFATFPDFNHADDNSIIDAMSDRFEAFNELSLSSDVNALVEFFERLVTSCIRRFIPLKTKKKQSKYTLDES